MRVPERRGNIGRKIRSCLLHLEDGWLVGPFLFFPQLSHAFKFIFSKVVGYTDFKKILINQPPRPISWTNHICLKFVLSYLLVLQKKASSHTVFVIKSKAFV
ncbi:unnamed protein product [Pipistrellus nathusii]|uniref:Uncharacterized protein n=1 Tax=Pipistrellus nathusii TaxID=59473 RepID=A0ABN9ZIL8_PIPNA